MNNQSSQRFNGISSAYATSEVHAASPTLRKLHAVLGESSFDAVCDVACGAGHTGLSFAARARRIVGVDAAPNMLAEMRALAQARGLAVETVLAQAEELPFRDEAFDLALCRLAAHHFTDVQRAVQELQRVTRGGGRVAVIDLEGNPDPALDQLNDDLERLHDPTHVRSYPADRWRQLFEAAGLRVDVLAPGQSEMPDGLSVRRWCEISSSGAEAERQIRARLGAASGAPLAPLGIERRADEFYLFIRTVLIVGTKA